MEKSFSVRPWVVKRKSFALGVMEKSSVDDCFNSRDSGRVKTRKGGCWASFEKEKSERFAISLLVIEASA